MRGRFYGLFLGLILCFIVGCGAAESPGQSALEPEPENVSRPGIVTEPRGPEEDGPNDYRIGILTGSRFLHEEEFRMAERMRALYGERIVTAVCPDIYPDDPTIVASSAINLAADPLVKVIVIAPSPPGTVEAVKKIRKLRSDILFLCGTTSESPEELAAAADIVLHADEITIGASAVRQSMELGAETFVHYGYLRALQSPLSAARRDRMLETCEEEGLEFIEVEVPDPADDYGAAATIRFLEADIPRQLERYGANTAFFGADPVMQETLIRGVMEGGAIFPLQCSPSPTLGYPGALGFQIPDDRLTDTAYAIDRIREGLEAWRENSREEPASQPEGEVFDGYRLSTWDINGKALVIEACIRYGIERCEDGDGSPDDGAFRHIVSELTSEYGGTAVVTEYEADGKLLENFFLFRGKYVTF